jgi:hypothetical protein
MWPNNAAKPIAKQCWASCADHTNTSTCRVAASLALRQLHCFAAAALLRCCIAVFSKALLHCFYAAALLHCFDAAALLHCFTALPQRSCNSALLHRSVLQGSRYAAFLLQGSCNAAMLLQGSFKAAALCKARQIKLNNNKRL